ncbi:purine-nucleoside phosphorylase [Melioribacter sp. OK-6-Me]|uniref:purine-nucleoside phosphorylase n=1 Tax=unclassified Melioribacter TaxID=2627329 RepID=UPI003ED85875
MLNLKDKYKKIVESINSQMPFTPEICIVLGSGLGSFADNIKNKFTIPTKDLPGYPSSTVEGHKGYLHFMEIHNKKILVVQGRLHFYEGYRLSDCLLPVHIASQIGAKKIILTNAAGGVNKNFVPGDLMLASSFISFNIKKEMAEVMGAGNFDSRNRSFPSEYLNEIIKKAAAEEMIFLKEGVYWFNKGPSYETPAEINMLLKINCDAVGMSTVHEAFYAHLMGMETSSISCITNMAAGISQNKLSHQEVIDTAELVREKFERLVKKTIELL